MSDLEEELQRIEDEGGHYDALLREASNSFVSVSLQTPLFLNSVPKCGTILLRNILLMFVGFEQIHSGKFIIDRNLREYASAFDPERPMFSWGHLNLIDEAARTVGRSKIIILVRDPHAYVLANLRFLMSQQTQDPFSRYVRSHRLSIDRVIALVIFGNWNEGNYCVPLRNLFVDNAIGWLGEDTTLIRYEDLVRHVRSLETEEAFEFFRRLVSDAGLGELPFDWRERVLTGADRKLSSTARENLSIDINIPDELTRQQKAMVEVAAPGIRRALGYEW